MDLIKEANRMSFEDEEGQEIAEVTFPSYSDNTYAINYTYVAIPYRNQKVAEQLIKEVVEQARSENKKIIPLCSFAVLQFRRKKDYEDVWEK